MKKHALSLDGLKVETFAINAASTAVAASSIDWSCQFVCFPDDVTGPMNCGG
jgi:hypothetical protein